MTNYVGVSFAGRLGNQLFQYAFARAYAQMHNAVLQTPEWIGQKIFELSDLPPIKSLPNAGFDEIPNGVVNITLNGYFQYQSAINIMTRHTLKSWLKIQNKWKQRFATQLPIAAHIRRGDYLDLQHAYCLIGESSYIKACEKFNLCTSDINWIQESSKQSSQDLIDNGLSFLEDFMLLINANVLLRANSTFSWWAGVLGNGRVFSPLVENRIGEHNDIEFVEGNWPRMVDRSNCQANITDLYLKD